MIPVIAKIDGINSCWSIAVFKYSCSANPIKKSMVPEPKNSITGRYQKRLSHLVSFLEVVKKTAMQARTIPTIFKTVGLSFSFKNIKIPMGITMLIFDETEEAVTESFCAVMAIQKNIEMNSNPCITEIHIQSLSKVRTSE